MGWKGWTSSDSGNQINEKSDTNSDGSKTEQYMHSKGSDRADHNHVVVNTDSKGKITSAHGTGHKKNR